MTDQSKEDKFDELLNAPVDPGELTDQEKFDELVDVITELAAMMVTHVDPRVVAELMTRLDAIRTPTEE